MYKDYNMIQLTLPMAISVLIPINDIVKTNTKTEFICPNHKRLGFKKYTYRHDKYGFKRDFKLYECDDDSECPLKHPCMNFNSKTNKKVGNILKRKLIKSFQKQKPSIVKEKLMW